MISEIVVGSGDIFPSLFTLAPNGGEQWVSLRPIYPWGKGPRYPLDERFGGSWRLSGLCDEEKYVLPLPRIKSWPLSQYTVTTLTELSRLRLLFSRSRLYESQYPCCYSLFQILLIITSDIRSLSSWKVSYHSPYLHMFHFVPHNFGCGDMNLTPHPKPWLRDHALPAIRDCFFNILHLPPHLESISSIVKLSLNIGL